MIDEVTVGELEPAPRTIRPKADPRKVLGASLAYMMVEHHLSTGDISGNTGINEVLVQQLVNGEDTGAMNIRDLRKIAGTLFCDITVILVKGKRYNDRSSVKKIFERGGKFRLKLTPLNRKRSCIHH